MIGSEIQQKFFARHTQHAVTLQAIFAAVQKNSADSADNLRQGLSTHATPQTLLYGSSFEQVNAQCVRELIGAPSLRVVC
jgi:hypothetical protein